MKKLFLENILEGLILCDKDLNLKYINQEAESLIGYSEIKSKKYRLKTFFEKISSQKFYHQ